MPSTCPGDSGGLLSRPDLTLTPRVESLPLSEASRCRLVPHQP